MATGLLEVNLESEDFETPPGRDVALGLSEGSCATSSVSVVGGTSSMLAVEGRSSELFGSCATSSPSAAIGDGPLASVVEGGLEVELKSVGFEVPPGSCVSPSVSVVEGTSSESVVEGGISKS